MAEFEVGKPIVAVTGRKVDTTDEFSLEGSYTGGSEVLSNGDFNGNADDWTLNDSSSYSGGKVVVDYEGSDDPVITQAISLVLGTVYLLTFTISNSNTGVAVYFDNQSAASPNLLGDGVKAFLFTADVNGSDVLHIDTVDYVNGKTWTIDDVSLKPVTDIKQALIVSDGLGRTVLELGGGFSGNLVMGVEGLKNSTGERNIAIGDNVGQSLTSANDCILIGDGADGWSPTEDGQIVIGPMRMNGSGVKFNGTTPTTYILSNPTTLAELRALMVALGLAQ